MKTTMLATGLACALFGLLGAGRAAAQDVQFLHCVPTAAGALEYTCSIAGPCSGLPCAPALWLPIDGVQTLPASFFAPGGTRASAIQVTPEPIGGSVYTLVNKDVGGQRWAIIQEAATGVVTGNVFSGAGGERRAVPLLPRVHRRRGVGAVLELPPGGARAAPAAARRATGSRSPATPRWSRRSSPRARVASPACRRRRPVTRS